MDIKIQQLTFIASIICDPSYNYKGICTHYVQEPFIFPLQNWLQWIWDKRLYPLQLILTFKFYVCHCFIVLKGNHMCLNILNKKNMSYFLIKSNSPPYSTAYCWLWATLGDHLVPSPNTIRSHRSIIHAFLRLNHPAYGGQLSQDRPFIDHLI